LNHDHVHLVYANYGMIKDSVARAVDAVPSPATNALRMGAIPVNPTLFIVGMRHTFYFLAGASQIEI
jgi:hypothetical protein